MEEYIKLLSVVGLLLSAVGIGNIVVKVLDIIWLQRNIRKSEIDKWKRDQKIVAYSKLANDLISQKEWGNSIRSPKIYNWAMHLTQPPTTCSGWHSRLPAHSGGT